MKKIFTMIAIASMAANVLAQTEVIKLDLTKPVVPSSINYVTSGYWDGTYDENVKELQFGDLVVTHLLGSSWGGSYWDGFTVCKSSDTSDHSASDGGWIANQWYNIAGGGAKDVEGALTADAETPYLVANYGFYVGAPEQTNQVYRADKKPMIPIEAWVTNSTWAYYVVENGGAPARAFTDGDELTLVAHGVRADNTESEARFTLAKHDGTLQRVDKWTRFDLSPLGQVNSVYFSVESTDMGDWGMNTPAYFCLGGMTAEPINPTAVDDINSQAQACGVTYVNVVGQTSAEPFGGVNIVVTSYTDGSQTTRKVVF